MKQVNYIYNPKPTLSRNTEESCSCSTLGNVLFQMSIDQLLKVSQDIVEILT